MAELDPALGDLLRPEAVADPFPPLAAIRAADPVHWSVRHRAWLITRFDDVAAVHTDPRLSSDRMTPLLEGLRAHGSSERLIRMMSILADWMTFKDGADHRRLRFLVNRAFTPRVVARMREQVEAITNGLIDELPASGEADLVEGYAYPLPAIVIAEMLGVPTADRDRFKSWSGDISSLVFGAVDDPDRHDRAESGMTELVDYFEGLLAAAAEGGGDETLLDHLVRVRGEDGDALSHDELLAMCTLLLFGGHETTTNLLSGGTLALLAHPEEQRRLEADPGLAEAAVEEFLRFDGPAKVSVRVAAERLQLRSKTIEPGDRVFLVLTAANRDPEGFPDPDRLDLTRAPNRQIGFGIGPHYCLGAPLARLEGVVSIPLVLRRLEGLRMADGAELHYRPTLLSRSLVSLPVSYDAVRPARAASS